MNVNENAIGKKKRREDKKNEIESGWETRFQTRIYTNKFGSRVQKRGEANSAKGANKVTGGEARGGW